MSNLDNLKGRHFFHFDNDADAARETSPSFLPALPVALFSPRSFKRFSSRSVMSVSTQTGAPCTDSTIYTISGLQDLTDSADQMVDPCQADDLDLHPLGRIEGTQIESLKPAHSNDSPKPPREGFQPMVSPKGMREPLPLPVLKQTLTDAKGKHIESAQLTDSVLFARMNERLERALRPKNPPRCSPRRISQSIQHMDLRSAAFGLRLPLPHGTRARNIRKFEENVVVGNDISTRSIDNTRVAVPQNSKPCVQGHSSFKRLHDTQTIASSIKDHFSITEHRKKYCMPSIVPKIPEVFSRRGGSPSSRRVQSKNT